ncbi:MAG TPA: c-type cytochrome domain-containing protein [Planctomycetota bacterium]|nr:c-type cytochrome domain-containing protein [Planctomycetota bacterium]
MPPFRDAGVVLLLLGAALPLHSQDDKTEFGKDIVPLLKAHCLACHTHGQVKGELRLDTIELVLKGGETGPAIVKGSAEKSLLYQVVAGKDELVMPPRKNKIGATPLSPPEVALLKRWIDEGAWAAPRAAVLNAEAPKWRPLPPGPHPIHSVALTGDGQLAACGRANQIFVYSLGAGTTSARLADPELRDAGIADHDYIQSLAFSPDGSQLAAGGYRSIRLWRKHPAPPQATLEIGSAAGVIALSPDGKILALAGPEGSILRWDLGAGTKLPPLEGHTGPVQCLAFSPDGLLLASGSGDKTIRVVTLAGGPSSVVQVGQDVQALSFTGDGKRLAAATGDFLIRLYSLPAAGASWEAPKELKGHSATIHALRPVGPGKQILSGSEDGSLRLWNAESGKEDRKMDHGAPVTDLAVWPDGKRWASAGGAGLKLWKQNGELQSTLKGDRRTLETQSAAERTVSFYKEEISYFKATSQENEKTLATESESVKKAAERLAGLTKETAPKEEAGKKAAGTKAELEKSLLGSAGALKQAAAARLEAEKVLPEAKKAAAAAAAKAALAKAEADKASRDAREAAKALDGLSPDAPAEEAQKARKKADAAKKASETASAALGDAEKAAGEAEAKAKAAQDAAQTAAKSVADLTEREKDLDTKLKAAEKTVAEGLQATQSLSAAQQNHERLLQVEHRGREALAASKDSLLAAETLLKAAEDAVVTAKKAVADAEAPIQKIALSPDGRMIASSGAESFVRTWNPETAASGEDYGPLDGAPQAIQFLPGGALLVASGTRTRLFNRASDWTLERKIGDGGVQSPLLDRVLALAYSPDGKILVSGGGVPSQAGELKLWNPQTGALLREIKDAHSDTVFTIAFSRDGRMLASGGADKLIKIWDSSSGAFVRLFEGHTAHVLGLAWRRSGRILMSAGADKVAKVWDLVSGEQTRTIEGFRKEVTAVAWLEVQNEMLLASGDGQLRSVKEDGNKNRGYQFGKGYIESAAATTDGKWIVAGGSDSELRVFEVAKDKLVTSFGPPSP